MSAAGRLGVHLAGEVDVECPVDRAKAGLLGNDGRRVGVEFKRSDAPKLTTSMRIALHDLRLDALLVVYPGIKPYTLADRVVAVPARDVATFVS